jgi:hypothetical protein
LSTPRPGRFIPGKDPLPTVQEAERAPEPVWTGAENLVPPGFDPRAVRPVTSRYTNNANTAHFSARISATYEEPIKVQFPSQGKHRYKQVILFRELITDYCVIYATYECSVWGY